MIKEVPEIWQAFKNGNQESFRELYYQYFAHLYEYGVRLISDKELVKDSIHDLFVKLWNNKNRLGDITNVRSYLLVSLRSTIYNRLQRNTRIKLVDEVDGLPFEMEFSVESKFVEKESQNRQTQLLLNALNRLSPRQKEAIYLRYFEEMGYEEIATIMEITVKATYKLTARGIETLRQVLGVSGYSICLLFALLRYPAI